MKPMQMVQIDESLVQRIEKLEAEIVQLRKERDEAVILGIGWAYADACCALDRGDDPRTMEVPAMLERAKRDLEFDSTKTEREADRG